MFSPSFDPLTEKKIYPNEHAMLCDLTCFDRSRPHVIGTSVRIDSLDSGAGGVFMNVSGAAGFTAHIRILLPFEPQFAEIDGRPCGMSYDDASRTALLTFESQTGNRTIVIR